MLVPRRSDELKGLFVVTPGNLAGFRVGEMYPSKSWAWHCFVGVVILGRIVRRPGLHLAARVWAAVEEWSHSTR